MPIFPTYLCFQTFAKSVKTLECVFLKDIYERHKIDNPAEFEELVRVIASSIGLPLNPNKLVNTFKSLKNTKDLTNKTIAT